jgi:hypothetical protein
MKYAKTLWHTYVTISGSWWKWHVWISSEFYPLIGIFIQSDDLSPPPVEKILLVGCQNPTSSLPHHHLDPACHAGSRGPLRRISTLGPKPGTNSKKKMHNMEAKP